MRIAIATVLAAAAAVIANLALRALAVAVFDIHDFEPLDVRPVILSTLGGVIAAGLLYALVKRTTRDPRRVFLTIAVMALLLSLIAPLTLDDPNADAESVGTLVAMHVAAAAISVPTLLRV
jgi:uncharacterized protein DUF6069